MSPLNCPYSKNIIEIMTTSLQAKQDIETRVAGWVQTYADTITKNYRDYHIRTLKGNLSGNYPEYAREQLDEIENGTAKLYKFVVKTGKRYYKIVQQDYREASEYYNTKAGYRDGSVHCFVDKKSGDVYKAASWNAPAKHVRYSFQNTKHLRFLLDPNNVGWAGGYLYMR